MQRRMKLVCSTILVTLLFGVGFVPATSAEPNVCVSVNGVNYVSLGNAGCYSDDGNTSVAVGDGSYSSALEGSNTSVAVGNHSASFSEYGDGNTSVAVGEDTFAESYGGDNNTAVATGYYSHTDIYNGDNNTGVDVGGNNNGLVNIWDSDNNTGVAVGEDSSVDIVGGDDNSLTVINDTDYYIFGENYCFAVVIGGQVYGDEDCLA